MKTMNQVAVVVAQCFKGQEDWSYEVGRGWRIDESLSLSDKAIKAVLNWVQALDRLVPSELDYTIQFSREGYYAEISMKNGFMCESGGEFPIELDAKAKRILASFDWEPIIRELMMNTEMMDEPISEDSGPVPQWYKDHILSGGKP